MRVEHQPVTVYSFTLERDCFGVFFCVRGRIRGKVLGAVIIEVLLYLLLHLSTFASWSAMCKCPFLCEKQQSSWKLHTSTALYNLTMHLGQRHTKCDGFVSETPQIT